MEKLNESINYFKMNITPAASLLSSQIGRGLGQVKQYAQEKLGTAEDLTELPEEYKALEKKVDALHKVHVSLLKLMRHDSVIPPALGDITRTIKEGLSLESPATSPVLADHPNLLGPKTFSHAVAAASLEGSKAIGESEPLGNALAKYSSIQEKIGDAKLNLDSEVENKFTIPYQATLNHDIAFSMKARRTVLNSRLHLDAVKSRFKSASPHKIEQARAELDAAEDGFVRDVEEAIVTMKRCVDNVEPLRNLADLVNAQLSYYKAAHELLEGLAPEIDEIQVNQEVMFRNQV